MNADERRSALIRVNPRLKFMASCLCPFQGYRAPVSPASVVASPVSDSAVAPAQQHVRLALVPAYARPASVVRATAAVAGVLACAAPVQRAELHVAPDHDRASARQVAAVAVVGPQ